MADTRELHNLGPSAVRIVWLFQGVIAAPTFILLGASSLSMIYNFYGPESIWAALRNLFLALFAAMIVFILLVQRKYADPHPKVTAKFELVKALLATAAWLWLLLDAIFRPPWYDPYHRYRTRKIIFTSASVVVLLFVFLSIEFRVTDLVFLTKNSIFFYPLVFWSARLSREGRRQATDEEHEREAASEDTPLLQD